MKEFIELNKHQIYLTTRATSERAQEVEQIADSLGISRHKVLVAALELGIHLAHYKLALEKIKRDKASRKPASSKLTTVKE